MKNRITAVQVQNKIMLSAALLSAGAILIAGGEEVKPSAAAFDLRIELAKPPHDVKLSGWSGGKEWLAPGAQGAKLEVGLEPGDYFLVLTVFDSTAPEHKDDKLAVTANKTLLGEFHRGKTSGWSTWYAAVPETALLGLGPDVPEVFSFAPSGNAPAMKEVRFCSELTETIIESVPKYVKLYRTGWNINARRFMRAPVLQVKPMEQAVSYRCTIEGPVDADETTAQKVESDSPELDLSGIWDKLPPAGKYDVIIDALDAGGEIVGQVVFGIHKSADFHKAKEGYRPAARGYGESGRMAAEYILKRFADNAKPLIAQENIYPALFDSFYLTLLSAYLGELDADDERTENIIELADAIAARMIATSTPGGWAYPHLPVSHLKGIPHRAGATNVLQVCRAPMAGLAYLELHKATKSPALLDAAMRIADTLKSTQLPEGRWYFRVEPQTGAMVEDYTSDQANAILFFDDLIENHGRDDLAEARDKAVKWMFENPVKTHLWQNQWDDMMEAAPYQNLDFFAAARFAEYLLRHASPENGYMQTALALFNYVEDQFVFWENSHDASWIVPSVAEQYWCYRPIDAHAGHYIRFCLAMHKATGVDIYMRKAKTMSDTLTAIQHPDGYYATFIDYQKPVKVPGKPDEIGEIEFGGVWINCTAYVAESLLKLERRLAEVAPPADRE